MNSMNGMNMHGTGSATTPPTPPPMGKAASAAAPRGRRRHKHLPGNEDLCKYASKACYIPRVIKKTGDLHRYCEHHRVQANRNQQRLEQRRRVQKPSQRKRSPMPLEHGSFPSNSDYNNQMNQYLPLSSYSSSESNSSGYSSTTPERMGSRLYRHYDNRMNGMLPVVMFEPFRQPVSLHREDLSSLFSILVDPSRMPPPPPPLHPASASDTEQVYQL